MKVLMIFDQIQAGMGGKERSDLPPGGKKGSIGSAPMIEPHLKNVDGEIVACLYCGNDYFKENEEVVTKKMTAMVKKINPDVVICGPAYNYKGYAYMCAVIGKNLKDKTDIPVVAAMSKENEDIISEYKDALHIVKMPKKGGIGLSESLNNICVLARKMFDKKDIEELAKKICY
ncbi:proline reductase [Tepidanaerobacter syntrophicus]|uniref:Glycine reductase n=1 Tax=Tepidanaerobacter syntrophicus TaxID=224999 RepID=A0A0U9HFT0_9FIRM|nr:GrdB-related putative oxidoreductase [Tepidanaerobacter syntrophicus]GAQ25614.1 glycine reductase [Tepidanaerobacter syntrophicus]GLI19934.1 proline reductase [Tepidanaerobacter syntrophicus]GLI51563.1 proline reductase [Tepidanaerobacter syntrophicus]